MRCVCTHRIAPRGWSLPAHALHPDGWFRCAGWVGVRATHAGNAGTRRMRRSPVRLPHGVGVQVIGYAQHAERRRPLHRASRDLGGVASASSPPGEVSALKKKKKKNRKKAFAPFRRCCLWRGLLPGEAPALLSRPPPADRRAPSKIASTPRRPSRASQAARPARRNTHPGEPATPQIPLPRRLHHTDPKLAALAPPCSPRATVECCDARDGEKIVTVCDGD